MTPNNPTLLPQDLNARALLATSQLDFLLDEADHHVEHDQAPSLQAVSDCLVEPLNCLARLVVPLDDASAQFDTPERENARKRAEQRLHDIEERVRTSHIDAHVRGYMPMATEAEESSVQLMSTVLRVIAGFAAQQALAEAVHDQSSPLEQRWAHLSALHADLTFTQVCVYNLSETLSRIEQSPADHDLAWLRLGQLMTEATPEKSPYHAAIAALCWDSGITHLSPGSIHYPDAIRCMVERLQPSKKWELGAWCYFMEQHDFLQVVRFDHNGERHVKTIYEPYPDGYPSDLVKEQMIDLLNALDDVSGHADPDFYDSYVAANAMYEAATLGLHTRSLLDFEQFMDEVRHKVDDQTIGDYIFRSATARNRDLGRLMTPPDTESPPLANPEQAAAILAAARDSGMSDTQLWELALVLGVEPDEHGLVAPIVSWNAVETLMEAPGMFGIPQILVDRLVRTLDAR